MVGALFLLLLAILIPVAALGLLALVAHLCRLVNWGAVASTLGILIGCGVFLLMGLFVLSSERATVQSAVHFQQAHSQEIRIQAPHGQVTIERTNSPAGDRTFEDALAEIEGRTVTVNDIEIPIEPEVEVRTGPAANWAEKEPWQENRVFYAPVATGRYSTPEEARLELETKVNQKTSEYLRGYLNRTMQMPTLPPRFMYDTIVRDSYVEAVDSTILDRKMYRAHGLLAYDRQVQSELERLCREQTIEQRLWYATAGLLGVLSLLAVLYGGLKMLPDLTASEPTPASV